MTGLVVRLLFFCMSFAMGSTADTGFFCGGTMSFYFVNKTGPDLYRFQVTVITGWVLNHGPCGPGCSQDDVGKLTSESRRQVINSTGKPNIFGNWSLELEVINGRNSRIDRQEITDHVNQNIQGRVSAISNILKWEQEIAEVHIDINTSFSYTDVALSGQSWKTFDLNNEVRASHTAAGNNSLSPLKDFNIQTKIRPKIRNDTAKPNSSPLVLYKPMYRVELNKVTEIRLTSSDKDGDMIQCRLGRNVEVEGLGDIRNVTISKDCIVSVAAMEQYGYKDNAIGIVGVVLEDFNRQPIQLEGNLVRSYTAGGLSSSVLDFMILVVANLTAPEFVEPTPVSQHVYTVYAGSLLAIPMAARPSPKTPQTTKVVDFHLISLPDHNLTASAPLDAPERLTERVVLSSLSWRTSSSDTGDFIIQVIAIDSEGSESLDRSYKIHVSDLPQDIGKRTDANPYFPFFPKPGSITCLEGATCSVPIFVRPGTPGRVISSIGIVHNKTEVPEIETSEVDYVQYQGVSVYRADIHFTADMVGEKPICFVAMDDHNFTTERCVEVLLFPPNPCDLQPCAKGATCLAVGANYTCLCVPGTTGADCNTKINPCDPSPCQNGGYNCAGRLGTQTFFCHCLPGFTGLSCETIVELCMPSPCQNDGICYSDEQRQQHCKCINGYTGPNCTSTVPNNPCAGHCSNDSICVVNSSSGLPACKCPLQELNDNCQLPNMGTPLIQPQGVSEPHSVLPTLRPGSMIVCNLGSTCAIPIFLQGSLPQLTRGMSSPNVATAVMPLKEDNITGLPNTLTSSLSVSPQAPGNNTACLEIGDSNGNVAEELCYIITTPDPEEQAPTPATPTTKTFTKETPPDGSVINCVTSQSCHILPRTVMPNSGNCAEVAVRPVSAGAYAFNTLPDPSSGSCATNMLLEPTSIPTAYVCLVVGSDGEKRCYTVNTIDDKNQAPDPCSPNPCQNNGVCLPVSGTPGYVCVCHVPYSGTDCSEVEDCSSYDWCENQGVCVDNTSQSGGFHCDCQPGFGPINSNCRHEFEACSQKQCEKGALCVKENSGAVCKCPLGEGGPAGKCHDNNTFQSVEPVGDLSKPHTVVPSLGPGTIIYCDVGNTCSVPVYITGDPSNPPHVTTGPTSTEITANTSAALPAKMPAGILTSALTVTPSQPGHHHVCVEIRENSTSVHVENICYNVESKSTLPGQATTTSAPGSSLGAGLFARETPSSGAEIRCREGTPCHIITYSQKPPSGGCADVRTQTVGVYTFKTTELDSATCVTDMLIDPPNMQNSQNACVQVGLAGERRCFTVTTTDPTVDPCSPSPCLHGVCIPDSSMTSGYSCACPVPYKGSKCDKMDTCTSGRCLNQAVCTDLGIIRGFQCGCQSGYDGDDCRHDPDMCNNVNCENGAFCVEENGFGVCKCPLGNDGITCYNDNADIPVSPKSDHTRPHLVIPSLGNGHVINCTLHQTCSVPLFVTDYGGPVPRITTGPTSPNLTAVVISPNISHVLHDTLTSTLTVTPKALGRHHICVEINDNSGQADLVCYTVNVDTSPAPTTPVPVSLTGGKFTLNTAPDGSTIVCRDDTPCHIMAFTARSPQGDNCTAVQPQTVGVFSFHTTEVDLSTCATDVLIDPVHLSPAGDKACLQAGPGGERRCFVVNTIQSSSDPCKSAHCQNGGHCIPDGMGRYACVCAMPYSGNDCTHVDDCRAQRCVNQALCRDGAGINGFQCLCQPGYNASDCRHAHPNCVTLNCGENALCVEENGHVVCKCALNNIGIACPDVATDIPVNHIANKTEPHSVIPSLGNGYEIDCNVGQTCPIPVYIHAAPGEQPQVRPGLSSPGISGIMTPVLTSVLPDTVLTTLSVTPSTAGVHHTCVNVQNGAKPDVVCYTINSQFQGQDQSTTVAQGQSTVAPSTGSFFTGGTPPNDAHITCRNDRPCHIIAQSEMHSPGAVCESVKTESIGAYSFAIGDDGQICNTDVLLDLDHIVSNSICIRLGVDGEKRCYTIHKIDSASDPCDPGVVKCQNGGQCVNMPHSSPDFRCVCPPFFDGDICQIDNTSEPVNRNAEDNKPHAVQPTPINGLEIPCETGSTCVIPIYFSGGGHVTPGHHAPSIQTSTSLPTNSSQLGDIQVSLLTIVPTSDGHHDTCVNVEDDSGVVDNICYTVISSSQPGLHTSPIPAADGKFKNGTLPDGSNITCHADVLCHLVAFTDKSRTSHQCTPVQTLGNGISASQALPSSTDNSTCDTDILIDPQHSLGQEVCVQTVLNPNSSTVTEGEKRCFTVKSVTDIEDKCSNNPCLNTGQCLLIPQDPSGFRCVCPDHYIGDQCETISDTDVPVNPTADKSKPHAIVPTPVNGLEIPCDTGSMCSIPVYIIGDGLVTPSLHTPNIETNTTDLTVTTHPPNTSLSSLTVCPTTDGRHHACVDIVNKLGVVDNICYTIVSVTRPSAATTTISTTGGRFKGGTLPDGANITCRSDIPCHLIAHTDKPPSSQQCIPVKTQGPGLIASQPIASSLDSSTCDIDLSLVPQQGPSQEVCIEAGFTAGEKRCFNVDFIKESDDKCATGPCLNTGECLLLPRNSSGFHCICPDGYTGDLCEDALQVPVNNITDTNKPHAIVPTPVNGLEIPCATGSTCSIPIYFVGGGDVTPGQHTPDIQTNTLDSVTTSHPSNANVSSLTVHPTADGQHHVCVDIVDNSDVVDNICYTVISVTTPAAAATTVAYAGGRFKDGTLPDGSTITCRIGIPCQMVAQTDKSSTTQLCSTVVTRTAGLRAIETVSSAVDNSTCDTVVMIDTTHALGHEVCIAALVTLNIFGEERCYNVTSVTDAEDKCSSKPCQNRGECLLLPETLDVYCCVCPDGYAGDHCEIGLDVPVNILTDKSKPHAIVPTPLNGLEIPCATGSTCSIPVYVLGGGDVTPGQHSPNIQTNATGLATTSYPSNANVSSLTVRPTVDGRHHVCVDVLDHSGVVDNICYTVVSETQPSAASTTIATGGGRFKDGTLPDGSNLTCHTAVMCQLITFTDKPSASSQCSTVQTESNSGLITGPTMMSSSDNSTCYTFITIDPAQNNGNPVCIVAVSNNIPGEKRCFIITTFSDTEDKCSSKPCQNTGECLLLLGTSSSFYCVCPAGYAGDLCETAPETPLKNRTRTDRPHAIVPTPENGMVIPCTTGSTCTIPIYVAGGGQVIPGQHTPDIQTNTTEIVGSSQPSKANVTSLSVVPVIDGRHHVCVDVVDNLGVADSICYTVVSASQAPSPSTVVAAEGGRFKSGTPPNGSRIVCHLGAPCHLVAYTYRLPTSRQCSTVLTPNSGLKASVSSTFDSNICQTILIIDPDQAVGHDVCIESVKTPKVPGEKRCYSISTITDAEDKCSSSPCQDPCECVLLPENPNGFCCVCPDGSVDHQCRTAASEPVNNITDRSKPHAIMPSPVNGMEITCNTGSTCSIPIYVVGDGFVEPGQHTPDIQTSTTDPVASSSPSNANVSSLTVHPTTDGHHHVCVDVLNNRGVVDNICYTVMSVTKPSPINTTVATSGEKFQDGTPPDGSNITCRAGLSCQLIARTLRSSATQQCSTVFTNNTGVETYDTRASPLDSSICDTVVMIEPAQSGHEICIEAVNTHNVQGETRCYHLSTVANAGDKCSSNPCQNTGECLLIPESPASFKCVCPTAYIGDLCETAMDIPVNNITDKNKPHAIVPTPFTGLEIPCVTGSTCSIPIYVTGDGEVTPGQHTPNIQTNTSDPVATGHTSIANVTSLTVHPTSDGRHHVCVDILDNTGVVDNVCYTVISVSRPNETRTTEAPGGGKFKGGTLPAGSNITCVINIPCHLIVQTGKVIASQQCSTVLTADTALRVSETQPSLSDNSTCNTLIMIDLARAASHQVCIEAEMIPGVISDNRCYNITAVTEEDNKCSSKPCQNTGECLLVPESPDIHCLCPDGYTGIYCENAIEIPVNPSVDEEKPHAIVPTPVNGLEIPCETGSTCSIPIYVTGGGEVIPGQHTPGIGTNTTVAITTNRFPNASISSLTVHPITDGRHHACVDIVNDTRMVDNVCYTIVSVTQTSSVTTTVATGGGRFREGTLPDGSSIVCRTGVSCQVNAYTSKPSPSQSCAPVYTQHRGLRASDTVTSLSDNSICETVIMVDPEQAVGHQVCIEAVGAANIGGEKRCYSVTAIADTEDKCSSNPCLNSGECVLLPSNATGFCCVCPDAYVGDFCEEDPYVPVNLSANKTKPHAIMPTPVNGLEIPCATGSTCNIPVYVAGPGGGEVIPGQHTPDIKTNTTEPVATSQFPNTQVSLLTIHPTADGRHQACVDVTDSSGLVDSICYTVISVTQPTSASSPVASVVKALPTQHNAVAMLKARTINCSDPACTHFYPCNVDAECPRVNSVDGIFKDGTLPDGSNIACRVGLPCQLIAHTDKSSASQQCTVVNAQDTSLNISQPKMSSSDNSTCDTLISIDPVTASGHGVCVQTMTNKNTVGEKRCYTVIPVANTDDRCVSNPCQNAGECLLLPASSSFQCVCPGGYAGERCETEIYLPVNANATKTLPYAIMPTPVNGLEIPCALGSTCSIPVIAFRGGLILPGQHTPDIDTNTTVAAATNQFPNTQAVLLTVHPTTEGRHYACVDIVDKTGNGDTLCYTVVSSSQPSSVTPTLPATGGLFTEGTLPDGANITCHTNVPCQLIARTRKVSSSQPCTSVQTSAQALSISQPLVAPDGETCDSLIVIDPQKAGGQTVCIEAWSPLTASNGAGEKRCYTVLAVLAEDDNCSSNPCQNTGECVLLPRVPSGHHCICPVGYTGDLCETATDLPVNPGVNRSQPHVIVPTPVNGLEMSCATGSMCSIPIYFTGGGEVTPGQHTPDIETNTTEHVATSHPSRSNFSSLIVHPTADGHHHVCVNIVNNTGLADNVCYTIISVTQPTPVTSTAVTGEGSFAEGTLPDSSNIVCRIGLPCRMIARTDTSPITQQCNRTSVQTLNVGIKAAQTVVTSADNSKCDTVIMIDPLITLGHEVCIEAVTTPHIGGERRCYNVTAVMDADDKCSSNPCLNTGACLLLPRRPAGFCCVCPAGYTGDLCQTAIDMPVNLDVDKSKPYAIVPTPFNGLEIPCNTGSICSIPIYTVGDGRVIRGQHTPDIQTNTTNPVATSHPYNANVSSLTVHPTADGRHHVCVDIADSSRTVDNICFVIVSVAQPTASVISSATVGSKFLEGTLPDGSNITCRIGLPCQMVALTDASPTPEQCNSTSVQTQNAGPKAVQSVVTSSGDGHCYTIITIDPLLAAGHQVCIQAETAPNILGEKRCYGVTAVTNKEYQCANNLCQNGGECLLLVRNSFAFSCVCAAGYAGDQCEKALAVPVNPGVNESKPYAIVPTPVNGLVIPCYINSTCTIPVYITGAGGVKPGQHTLDIETSTMEHVATNKFPNASVSSFSVHPQTAGHHHACVDIVDNEGIVDNVCYTIISVRPPLSATATTATSTKGGVFIDGTLPDGSWIMCHIGVPCHLIVRTNVSSKSQQCMPVQTLNIGLRAAPMTSSNDSQCDTVIMIDPLLAASQNVCIQAVGAPNTPNEERCYKVTSILVTDDHCSAKPCQNQAECVLLPRNTSTFRCVCSGSHNGYKCGTAGGPGISSSNISFSSWTGGGNDSSGSQTSSSWTGILAANPNVNTSKPHVVLPTPLNGLEIPCATGSTCSIPIYVTGNGNVVPGPRSSTMLTTISAPNVTKVPDVQISTLRVTPSTDGHHDACVYINDSSGTVDSICYTVISVTTPASSTTTATTGGGRFEEGTLPDSSNIICRSDVPCHLTVRTDREPASGQCTGVWTRDAGLSVSTSELSASQNNICNTDILINPQNINDSICIKAVWPGQSIGEVRCYNVTTVSNEDNKCSHNPCQNMGECLLQPRSPAGFRCVCPAGYTGAHYLCDSDANVPVNSNIQKSRPHAILPTPLNGLEIFCDTGSTCDIPVYFTGGGEMIAGPRSSGVHSSPTPANITGFLPSASFSLLTVNPTIDGRHQVCANIKDNFTIVDSVCYSVVSITRPSSAPTTMSNGGGRFAKGTLPNESVITCRVGMLCNLIVYTENPSSSQCTEVKAVGEGLYSSPASPWNNVCASNLRIDPQRVRGNHFCITAVLPSNSNGESRCYTISSVTDNDDKCFANPCQNTGDCLLVPGYPQAGFCCVCSGCYSIHSCEGAATTQAGLTTEDPCTSRPCGTDTCVPLPAHPLKYRCDPLLQCRSQKASFSHAAAAGRVHCTCRKQDSNVTYTVIRPRVSNQRLYRAAGISSGVAISLMAIAALVYFLVQRCKSSKASNLTPSGEPSRDQGLQRRGSDAWRQNGGNYRR